MTRSSARVLHGRILIVDDNTNALGARRRVLEDLGHAVTTMRCPIDALETFEKSKFDVVVTLFKMQKMNGGDLIAKLRECDSKIRCIIISGFADTLGASSAATSADAVVQKSANEITHLIRAVDRLLHAGVAPKKPAGSQRSAKSVAPSTKRSRG